MTGRGAANPANRRVERACKTASPVRHGGPPTRQDQSAVPDGWPFCRRQRKRTPCPVFRQEPIIFWSPRSISVRRRRGSGARHCRPWLRLGWRRPRVLRLPHRAVGNPPNSAPSTVPHKAALKAHPCIEPLSDQRFWMGFSAPEITTVSKPNKKPARADVRAQKRRRDRLFIGCSFRFRFNSRFRVTRGLHRVGCRPTRRRHWRVG